jgi:hypothetical protein
MRQDGRPWLIEICDRAQRIYQFSSTMLIRKRAKLRLSQLFIVPKGTASMRANSK